MKTFMFRVNLRHVTAQIGHHLRKTSPVLRVSTHIYEAFEEIDGKIFISDNKPQACDPSK